MEENEPNSEIVEGIKRGIRTRLEQCMTSGPYRLNPDTEMVDYVIEGLARNELKHGFAYCTCRVPQGIEAEDRKIICPCDTLAEQVEQWGHCECRLFVEADVEAEEKFMPAKTIMIYEPVAMPGITSILLAPRLNDMAGKVVGLLDSSFWQSNSTIAKRLNELITEKCQAQLLAGKKMKWISHDATNVSAVPEEIVDDIVANCDAAIVMLGN